MITKGFNCDSKVTFPLYWTLFRARVFLGFFLTYRAGKAQVHYDSCINFSFVAFRALAQYQLYTLPWSLSWRRLCFIFVATPALSLLRQMKLSKCSARWAPFLFVPAKSPLPVPCKPAHFPSLSNPSPPHPPRTNDLSPFYNTVSYIFHSAVI